MFGTDGVRGRAGSGWLSAERVLALGAAIGAALRPRPGARAVLGQDGRRSGPALQSALGRGLSAAGFEVASAGLITSPGLATLVRLGGFDLGAMLSASHNPAEDNGIKLFAAGGEKLEGEIEEHIERLWRASPDASASGDEPRLDAGLGELYLEHLLCGAGRGLDLCGTTLVVDCANGAASALAPRLFAALGARVHALHASPDGDNINRGCGSTDTASLQREVRARGAALGVALDGDADRCILVDERGACVDGDGILAVEAAHAMRVAPYPDPRVVVTVMSNRGLERALSALGVGIVTVGVGDRSVAEALRRERLPLGGEPSGHLIFGADNAYVGDGLYTALRILRVLRAEGRPLSSLAATFRPYPQVLRNVRVGEKRPLAELAELGATVRRVEAELAGEGRVLLRYSGTEPLLRVMVEGPELRRTEELAAELERSARRELGGLPETGGPWS